MAFRPKDLAPIAELVATQQRQPQRLNRPVTTVNLASRAAKRFGRMDATLVMSESPLQPLVSLHVLNAQQERTLTIYLAQHPA